MTKYKNYYIEKDSVNGFKSKAEIDEYIRKSEIEYFKKLCKIFNSHLTIEASIICQNQADKLNKLYGISWRELEEIEISTI